ncbi:mechanosensitive ion channel protein MscS [Marinicauda salina]|uniref:Mechanosensitive ion channel protein MscS n=1 Tax=Marinicauda salina TaxID=2135793 RepID=A0A2U2BSP4_9PROT|nr:mechanosensitive ion channel family protein [Marinicauda salina]PWE17017.1 mechanosensitive ion channel protein MscS [Marinicauda salina]
MSAANGEAGIFSVQSIEDLWALVVEAWDTSFLGMNVGDGLMAVGVLLVAFLFRGLFSRLLKVVLKRQVERTETLLDDKVLHAVSPPLKLVPVIAGVYIAVLVLGLDGPDGAGAGVKLVQSLIVIALFWALYNAVMPVSHLLHGLRELLTPVLVDWLAKALRILFLIVGAGAVLQVWGIPVAPIVAGLGLFGVAVGLGAQDLFKNLIAGLLILTEKRFVPGEWILVDGVVEGHVEKINFRSTLVRRFDKSPVYVPNSFLADNAVTNFTRMTHRRIKWYIGVEYKTTVDQLKYIRDHVMAYIEANEEFAQAPEVSTFMRVDSFGASSIDFLLYAFTRSTSWLEWLRIKEELAFEIKRIVEEGAGTAFAFPSTTIYMDDGSEVFVPPQVREHSAAKTAAIEDQRAGGESDAGEDGGR